MTPKEYITALEADKGKSYAALVTNMAQGTAVVRLVCSMDAPYEQCATVARHLSDCLASFSATCAVTHNLSALDVVAHVEALMGLIDQQKELLQTEPAGHA